MKTKLIILVAAGSLLLFSCTNDTSEDEGIKPNSEAKIVDLKKLKINNKESETNRPGDTIVTVPPRTQSTSGEGLDPQDPSTIEGGDPKDVPPRK